MGDATMLAYPRYGLDDNDAESIERYAAQLENLFEPECEFEQMKINLLPGQTPGCR